MEIKFTITQIQLRNLLISPQKKQAYDPPTSPPHVFRHGASWKAPEDFDGDKSHFLEDSFEIAREKSNQKSAELLWKEKLREFEMRNEVTARRIAYQWQRERKTLEQVQVISSIYPH